MYRKAARSSALHPKCVTARFPKLPIWSSDRQSLADRGGAARTAHALRLPHLPSACDGGWGCTTERFADRVSESHRGLAPASDRGASASQRAPILEASHANLLVATWRRQQQLTQSTAVFAQRFPYYRYILSKRAGLVMLELHAPVGGVHGQNVRLKRGAGRRA